MAVGTGGIQTWSIWVDEPAADEVERGPSYIITASGDGRSEAVLVLVLKAPMEVGELKAGQEGLFADFAFETVETITCVNKPPEESGGGF